MNINEKYLYFFLPMEIYEATESDYILFYVFFFKHFMVRINTF